MINLSIAMSTANKVLKVTKPDSTVHVIPVSNKAFWEAHNNRVKAEHKVKLEVISEDAAKGLPFIDDSYVNAADAVEVVDALKKDNLSKEQYIKQLEKQLEMQTNSINVSHEKVTKDTVAPNLGNAGAQSQQPQKAEDLIALINAATTVEQVQSLAKDDERVTVKRAAEAKVTALTPADSDKLL